MSIVIYEHIEGMGCLEFEGGALIATNDASAVAIRIEIGPDGLRDLAFRLCALADVVGGAQ